MFLESIKSASRKKLETTCETLSADVKQKELELDRKEKQIERLSKNIRKWTRKYNELELTISQTVINELDSEPENKAHDEEKKHLQMMLVKLNRKNEKLEKRLESMATLLEKIENGGKQAETVSKTAPSMDANEEDFEPEFPAEFQKVLNHYAETTPAE